MILSPGFNKWAEGSCQVEFGDTVVLCTASVEEYQPRHRRDTYLGWVTAEYSMLPRSTSERRGRTGPGSRPDSRGLEISRLIGRSLRSIVDFAKLGPRTVTIDCDVMQADGGTRTAAITGAWVALAEACNWLQERNAIKSNPLRDVVAAVSVGLVGNEVLLDLDFAEDSRADVDFNVVMTGGGMLIELQGTGEERPFSRNRLDEILDVAALGITALTAEQKACLVAD